jgi:hypothetical protein
MKITMSSLGSPLLLLATLTLLGGCAQDYRLSPAPYGEKVSLTIKLPEDLGLRSMRVMYRSAVCQRVTYDGDGRPERVDGHNGFEVPLQKREGDLYGAELFIEGGGPCQWRLSNVDFGVKYVMPTPFGESVIPGSGGGVVIVFDHNNPQRRVSRPVNVNGADLRFVENYYPWVSESFIDGYVQRVRLSGKGGSYLTYDAPDARKIYFEPQLHRNYVVKSIAPKKPIAGELFKFYYPDGTVESDWRAKPSFEKLQRIRLDEEAKK